MTIEELFQAGYSSYVAGDFAQANRSLLPAAKGGHREAQFLIAEMYRWGEGVEQSATEAKHFYELAAEQGHSRAAFDLALLLSPSVNSSPTLMSVLVKDAANADQYFGMALAGFRHRALAGDAEAMSMLGFMYHNSLGVQLDASEAIRWYMAAFEAGDFSAANGLCLVYHESLDHQSRDQSKARYWYAEAEKHGVRRIRIADFEGFGKSEGGGQK